MCGHFYMYQNRYQPQRHRPVWRCTTCGREASVPLDCCGQPNFTPRQSVRLGRQYAPWLAETGRWVLTSLGALWLRRHQPGAPLVVSDSRNAEDPATEAVVVGAEDNTEATVEADVPVGAGERL
jgi:hypothetical protein